MPYYWQLPWSQRRPQRQPSMMCILCSVRFFPCRHVMIHVEWQCDLAKANRKVRCSAISSREISYWNGEPGNQNDSEDYSIPSYGVCSECVRSKLEHVRFWREIQPERKGGSVLGGINARTMYPEAFSDSVEQWTGSKARDLGFIALSMLGCRCASRVSNSSNSAFRAYLFLIRF